MRSSTPRPARVPSASSTAAPGKHEKVSRQSRPTSNDRADTDGHNTDDSSNALDQLIGPDPEPQQCPRLYKRRFVGLAQLVLINLIVSWDWLTFAAVSSTAAEFFNVSQAAIDWLSTAFLFAFLPVGPIVIYALRAGPKPSMLISSALVLVGNWIRYAGTRASPPRYPVVLFGQILIGFSQPFVLAAPTRYSNMWFSDSGRVTATAIASLANPLGGALGQLIGPMFPNIPDLVLYTAVISTVATIPTPFIPTRPRTPPSAIAAATKLAPLASLRALRKDTPFWLILLPFGVYVGLFNAISSLLNAIMLPYAFTEAEAGITGAILIVVGLIAAAIISPIVDKKQVHLTTIKALVPIIALSYFIFIFMPPTGTVAGPFIVAAVLGASSFALLPCTLEYLVLATHPVSPEITSTLCWSLGQLLGGAFIIVMNALKGVWSGKPDDNMIAALVFQAVVALAVVPLPLVLGWSKLSSRGATRN